MIKFIIKIVVLLGFTSAYHGTAAIIKAKCDQTNSISSADASGNTMGCSGCNRCRDKG